jgi:hypothetical protein
MSAAAPPLKRQDTESDMAADAMSNAYDEVDSIASNPIPGEFMIMRSSDGFLQVVSPPVMAHKPAKLINIAPSADDCGRAFPLPADDPIDPTDYTDKKIGTYRPPYELRKDALPSHSSKLVCVTFSAVPDSLLEAKASPTGLMDPKRAHKVVHVSNTELVKKPGFTGLFRFWALQIPIHMLDRAQFVQLCVEGTPHTFFYGGFFVDPERVPKHVKDAIVHVTLGNRGTLVNWLDVTKPESVNFRVYYLGEDRAEVYSADASDGIKVQYIVPSSEQDKNTWKMFLRPLTKKEGEETHYDGDSDTI